MTVVDIHPEDLIDKLAHGELSKSERAHLDAHLKSCEVCRLELELRGDFERDAAGIDVPQLPALQLTRSLFSPIAPRRTPRARRWVWAVAVAGLVTATGAVAGVVTRQIPWPVVWDTRSTAAPVRAPQPRTGIPARRPAPPNQVAPAVVTPAPEEPKPETREPPTRPPPRATPSDPDRGVRSNAEPELDPARSPSTLFAAANLARRHGKAGEAAALYRQLQSRYPGSEEARLSLITHARLELDTGHATSALALFDQYLRSGRRPLEAEAIVGRAQALRRLGRSAEEGAAWREVVRKYPDSAYAEQAAERLPALGAR